MKNWTSAFSSLKDGRIYTAFCLFLLLFMGIALWPENERSDGLGHLITGQYRYSSDNTAIPPLERPTSLDANKIELGLRLFSDPRLSADDSVSCAHCHNLSTAGTDGLPLSSGIGGKQGLRNSPTIFNAALNSLQFWDGRATSLEEQLDGPINNPVEMASNWEQVVAKIKADKDYRQSFSDLYTDGITRNNIKNAISTFERSLITTNSPFDQFQRGNKDAISTEAKAGYRLFINLGCISCHQGKNIGGNMFEKIGVMEPYFDNTPAALKNSDLGRFHLTNNKEHQYEFRVPSLRNVARTAPYFHDGSVATLDEAVNIMARFQLGFTLDQYELDQLVAFLESLTGEYNGKPL